MIDDKLKELERQEETLLLLNILKAERDSIEATITPHACHPYRHKAKKRTLISPYWLVAASMAGFIAGFFTPDNIFHNNDEELFANTDTVASCGYSIAQMDIDANLLFTM